ncbi:hypothetical protein [Mesorhizobium sp. NZP2077]|uniref:hypothetical protein n=1 Tax=Mesorhizobium sp. NZP2077 TaxID=2483404 RepID=UPI001FEF96C5|nr:hypothetical protein [Mesorhizobium sp. NZP2077]
MTAEVPPETKECRRLVQIHGIQTVAAISFRGTTSTGTFHCRPSFLTRSGGLELDSFQRLEALLDSAGGDGIDEANALLRRFKGKSQEITAAIDEFMLDFKTLVFVVETGEAGSQKSLRELARVRLTKLRQLMNVAA